MISMISIIGYSQGDKTKPKIDSGAVVITDSTEFINLSQMKRLDQWLKKTLTYDEYMKVTQGIRDLISYSASEFRKKKKQ